jgi:hypothetical protein
LRFDRISLLGGKLELGALLAYEHKFAGVLIDYYRLGQKLSERGFEASFLEGSAYVKANLPGDHYLSLTTGMRQWFFSTRDDTDSAFVLPPEATVFEPRLNYTFWRLDHDPSLRDRHRLFPRVRGLALGVELGLDLRSETRPWGAVTATALHPADQRNDPSETIVRVRQWLRAGFQLVPWLRTQLSQSASWGHGEDDLTRVRLGGLNPYVVPIAGAPWATFLSEKFIAVESSWHFKLWGEQEAGVLLHGVLLEDAERIGREDTYDIMAGLGVFVDLRFGGFQIDLRAGWSPTLDYQSSSGQFGAYALAGWQWD